MDAKLQEMKEASRKFRDGRAVGASNHAIVGDLLPSWDDLLEKEDSHDGNLVNWTFQQENRVNVDNDNKVIKHEISDNDGHMHDTPKPQKEALVHAS